MKYLRVKHQGDSLAVKPISLPDLRQLPPPKRGLINEFSASSRKRLVSMFARLDRDKLKFSRQRVKFLTLTYRDNFTDGEKSKLHLKRLMERLQYAFPDLWAVWRLELQERGAIHYHFIIGNLPYLDKRLIQCMWSVVSDQLSAGHVARFNTVYMKYLETKDSRQLSPDDWQIIDDIIKYCAFTRIEAIRSLNGVLSYASKYMCKSSDSASDSDNTVHMTVPYNKDWHDQYKDKYIDGMPLHKPPPPPLVLTISQNFGRYWGVYGRQNMPFAPERQVTVAISDQLYNWWLAKIDSIYCRKNSGFEIFQEGIGAAFDTISTVFGNFRHWWKILDQYLLDCRNQYLHQTQNWSQNVIIDCAINAMQKSST